jgi:fatty-acyl-CoA synthase
MTDVSQAFEQRRATNWGIWHWLERRADIAPQRTALADSEAQLSYWALRDRVASAAGALRGMGVRRGDRLAILSVNRAEYVEVLFAAAWIGAILVPLNWRLTASELAFQLGDSEPVVLFADPELADLAESLRARPEARGIRATIAFDADIPPPPWARPYGELMQHPPAPAAGGFDDPLLIMYTSGTTGRPKGAVLAQRTQLWNSINIGNAVALTADDVTLNVLPMFHIGGIGLFTLPTLHVGATAVLQRRFDPHEAVRLVGEHRVSAMFGVPSVYLMLMESDAFLAADLSGVRFCCGGAPCPPRIIEAFRERGLLFQQGYGLTETAPTCLIIPATDAFRKAGSAGKPAIHVEARVVDDEGRDVPPDTIGEVWTRGPNLFSGYWGRKQETEEAFEGDWFKTGDLARRDAEGFFYIVDRKKDMIISGGENIYPAEVEAVIYGHPAVADVAVIGVPHEHWGEVPKALVVLRSGRTLTADELFRFCEPHLARYKIPRLIEVVDALPRNAAGKVLKRELRLIYSGKPGSG